MSLKLKARSLIASRHGGFFSAKLARIAEQYLNAYNNIANWDIGSNGELRALRQVLGQVEGDVIDVGANVGQWATAVHPWLGGKKKLYSFEPVPQIFAALQSSLADLPGVEAINMGLGAEQAVIEINYNPDISTISSAFPLIYDDVEASLVQCQITTGDKFLADKGITAVSVLKIDVEGMEALCLSGFEQSLRAGIIATVQFEHGESHVLSGHTLKYFIDWFDARGFAVFSVFPKALLPVKYKMAGETYGGQNFFAVRRDLCARLLLSAG